MTGFAALSIIGVLTPWMLHLVLPVQAFSFPSGFPGGEYGMMVPNYRRKTFISKARTVRKQTSMFTVLMSYAENRYVGKKDQGGEGDGVSLYSTSRDHVGESEGATDAVRRVKNLNGSKNIVLDDENNDNDSEGMSREGVSATTVGGDCGDMVTTVGSDGHCLETVLTPEVVTVQQQLQEENVQSTTVQCRIVASADGKIPQLLPKTTNMNAMALAVADKIDSIYNAVQNKQLKDIESLVEEYRQHNTTSIQMLKESLSNSGFQLLSKRDMDLCKALNEGYILRLSIAPDLKDLDPNLYYEFYGNQSVGEDTPKQSRNDLLFDGKILVFRRGYGQEVTSGRLILPKLDYLQSSIVQRSAYNVVKEIEKLERDITQSFVSKYHDFQSVIQSTLDSWKMQMSSRLGDDRVKMQLEKGVFLIQNATRATGNSLNGTLKGDRKAINIKLKRYVGGEGRVRFVDSSTDEMDALSPFLVCEMDVDNENEQGQDQAFDIEKDLQRGINAGVLACKYDMTMTSAQRDSIGPDDDFSWNDDTMKRPTHLLNRVSIANLVNFFSKGGRRRLIKSTFAVSELVEPTYEEVVLIWRPLPKTPKVKKVVLPPKFVYDIFEIFALEHKLPQPPEPARIPDPPSLEIRAFGQVPMANLFAVLPKTKLIFRPADALIFDLVNVFSFLAVVASQKFDSPKLDFIALVSVCVWFLRTFFRYSNKIARYDLLVNKFLTNRISHRNSGAFKYIVSESATQRARRATLVHYWLAEEISKGMNLRRDEIVQIGAREVMKRLDTENPICIDVNLAVDDLVALDLIEFDIEGKLVKVKTGSSAEKALLTIWKDIL